MIVFITKFIIVISFITPILSTFGFDNLANCPKEALVNYSDINYNFLYFGESDISGLDKQQLNTDALVDIIDNDFNNETQFCLCSVKVCIAICTASALQNFQLKYVTINGTNQTVTFPLIYNSTTLEVMNETQLFNLSWPDNAGSFYVFSRDPCDDELKLEFNQDEFQLLTNSSIHSDEYEFIIDTDSYCFDFSDTGNFSAYICLSVLEIEFESHDPMLFIFLSGIAISMPCLVITIIIYTIFRELKNLHCLVVRNYCICLFFAYLSFFIVIIIPRLYFYPRLCKAGGN
ncbi:G-protein coupled receptor Mth-like [Chelonus insularis]|uniref:G-protein coupled receptor Mth-like n=1 Tax=Chelonus insularis TaxID=460826 RepID=UPI00158D6EDE|nr:G-protein coupled receptor Mth-like [Chelonus insularis]